MLQLKILSKQARREIEQKALVRFKKDEIIEPLIDEKIKDYESMVFDLESKIIFHKEELSKAVIDSEKDVISKKLNHFTKQKIRFTDFLNGFKELIKDIANDYAGFKFTIDITTDPLLSNQQVLENLKSEKLSDDYIELSNESSTEYVEKSEQPYDAYTLWNNAPLRNLEILKFMNAINDIYVNLPLELNNQEVNYVIDVCHRQMEDKLFLSVNEDDKVRLIKKSIEFLTELRSRVRDEYQFNRWYEKTYDKILDGDFELKVLYLNKIHLRAVSLYDANFLEKHIILIVRIGTKSPSLISYACAVFIYFVRLGFEFERKKIKDEDNKRKSIARLFADVIVYSLENSNTAEKDIRCRLKTLNFNKIQIDSIIDRFNFWKTRYDLPDITNTVLRKKADTISGYFGIKNRFGFSKSESANPKKIYEETSNYFSESELDEMTAWKQSPKKYIESLIT